MKRIKQIISLILCLCLLLLTAFPSVFTVYAADEGIWDMTIDYSFWDDPNEAEEPYTDGGTVYDLEGEVDMPIKPEEEMSPIEPEQGDDDSEIYTDLSFDAENTAQLANATFVSDEIIIKFKEPWQVPGKEKQLQHEIEKFEKIGFVEELDVYIVKFDDLDKNPNAVLNRLKNNKYIEYVEPNYIAHIEYIPNDPNYKAQAPVLTLLNAQAGWSILKGTSAPIIAVVDSGVVSHPDLPPLLNGYAAVAGLAPNNDSVGHGTGVAGTVGAIGDNGIGSAGINWNASILPVKVDDANGTLSVANISKGIIWAVDNGAKVINLSLGTTSDSVTFKNAIDYAYNKGCVIIAATGNDGKNAIHYPARYSNVMAVGSTTNGTSRVASSNYGPGINVVGLGAFFTLSTTGGYSNRSGTSFASPQVAALASMVWALNPSLTNDQVYRMIEQGAKPLGGGFNEQTGYGLIDIGKTLEMARASAGGSQPGAQPPAQPPVPPETPQEVRTPPVITLTGFKELTLSFGQAYVEMGYKAVDCKGLDITAAVKVTSTVNSQKAGLYTVTYDVADSAGLTARATRTVTVEAQPVAPPSPMEPKITIIGSNPIVLHKTSGTPYKEQMARAIDGDGKDISNLVTVSGSVNRTVAGTYTLTYRVTSPTTGLTASTTRNVRIVAPTERKDPRTKYGFSGQAKQGAKVTHTGIVSNAVGFMDLSVTAIDKNMKISVQLVDTTTKKAVLTDTFTATGSKQYRIDQSRYELVVSINLANGNSKYSVNLLMPETASTIIFTEAEVPLAGPPRIAPIGSNPIILHLGSGTPYMEQGARAADHRGNDLSSRVEIIGEVDVNKAGTYHITYRVVGDNGLDAEVTREVRILSPDQIGIDDIEIPMDVPEITDEPGTAAEIYIVISGDNLWRIAQKHYGDGNRWPELYEMNKEIIGNDPNRLKIGQELKLRAA